MHKQFVHATCNSTLYISYPCMLCNLNQCISYTQCELNDVAHYKYPHCTIVSLYVFLKITYMRCPNHDVGDASCKKLSFQMHYFYDQQPTLLPHILWKFVLIITHLIYLSVIFFFWGTILLPTLWYVEPLYSKSLQTGPVA